MLHQNSIYIVNILLRFEDYIFFCKCHVENFESKEYQMLLHTIDIYQIDLIYFTWIFVKKIPGTL